MDRHPRNRIYVMPKGYVTADPGRNRYIRERGTSLELPPILHPEYGQDIADPKNGIDWIGVATDLGQIGAGALGGVGGSVSGIVSGLSSAGLLTVDELRKAEQRIK